MESDGTTAARGFLDLPKPILQKVLNCCSYEEVGRLRAVCRTFRAAGDTILNDALFRIKDGVEARLRAMRPLLQQFASEESSSPWEPLPGEALLVARCAKLLTLQSELSLLHAVVARYVARGRHAFAGGRVLDLVHSAATDRDADAHFDVRAVSLLFFYNGAYLDHFERVVEPRLAADLDASAQRFGPKVVDLVCCSLFAGFQYILAYDGVAVNVMGVFDVVGRGVTAPPRGARTLNDDARCVEFARYLRCAIRWTNLTGVLDAARDGRAADVLRAEPAAWEESASSVDVLPASLQKALGETLASEELLFEHLFRRSLDRPRNAEGYTVSLDLKCLRAAMPALLRRQVDSFDSARAREARGEEPVRDAGGARGDGVGSRSAPAAHNYEFTMVLRARHYQASRENDNVVYPPDLGVLGTRLDILSLANPRRAGPLLESEMSMYQRARETTLLPGTTVKRSESSSPPASGRPRSSAPGPVSAHLGTPAPASAAFRPPPSHGASFRPPLYAPPPPPMSPRVPRDCYGSAGRVRALAPSTAAAAAAIASVASVSAAAAAAFAAATGTP